MYGYENWTTDIDSANKVHVCPADWRSLLQVKLEYFNVYPQRTADLYIKTGKTNRPDPRLAQRQTIFLKTSTVALFPAIFTTQSSYKRLNKFGNVGHTLSTGHINISTFWCSLTPEFCGAEIWQ